MKKNEVTIPQDVIDAEVESGPFKTELTSDVAVDAGVKMENAIIGIKPPNLRVASFVIKGVDGPLVQKRMGEKLKEQLAAKQQEGKSSGSKRNRTAQDMDATFRASMYVSKEGWYGFHAGAIRNALIAVCRLVDFKMTLAKLSIFVVADGRDKFEPQVPLVRLYGEPVRQDDIARVETGQPYVTVRAAFHDWSAKLRIRYDADQYSLSDVTNLLWRVGLQNGLGEGRFNSKNSTGMGWGCFALEKQEQKIAAD